LRCSEPKTGNFQYTRAYKEAASRDGRIFLCLCIWVFQYPGSGCNESCVLFLF